MTRGSSQKRAFGTASAGEPGGFQSLMLPAAGLVVGLQSVRAFLPNLVWYLGDTRGISQPGLAACASAAFLCAFLAAPLRRLVGPGLALWVSGAGLAVARVMEQLVPVPASDSWLSLAATALFALFLPLMVGQICAHNGRGGGVPRLAGGLVVGLALDSALKGAATTLDLSWISGPISYFITVALGAALLWSLALEPMADGDATCEANPMEVLGLLVIGPFLFLEAMVLQNQGWISQVLGCGLPQTFLVVMLGNVAAALGLILGLRSGFGEGRWPAALGCGVLVMAFAVAHREGPGVGALLMAAQVVLGWILGVAATASMRPRQRGLGWTTIWLGLGLTLFLVLAFVYYGSFYMALPAPRVLVLPLAALIVVAAGLGAAGRAGEGPRIEGGGVAVASTMALLLVPLGYWSTVGGEPRAQSPHAGTTLRVMTYNIHSAFSSQGRQDPEAIARVIEDSGADVVALQEVSRGWLINGGTDLATWLSRRLGMPFVFRGTADLAWGNAILSRHPIIDQGWGELPLEGTVPQRGYLWARVDAGLGEPVLVINTHLHHVREDHAARMAQVRVLLEFWGGQERTILLGDLNARPEYAEMAVIAAAGLVDSWAEAGSGSGLTWPARDPYERIDWVWHTTDLRAVLAEVVASMASDHLPVVVTLELGG